MEDTFWWTSNVWNLSFLIIKWWFLFWTHQKSFFSQDQKITLQWFSFTFNSSNIIHIPSKFTHWRYAAFKTVRVVKSLPNQVESISIMPRRNSVPTSSYSSFLHPLPCPILEYHSSAHLSCWGVTALDILYKGHHIIRGTLQQVSSTYYASEVL